MWETEESRTALADLDLDNRERILDVGCGTGELTEVLVAETSEAVVLGCDADLDLLRATHERVGCGVMTGDAIRLPVADEAVDLVACQALLVNLPDPSVALKEFARISSDIVAVIEPDNAGVTVESTVEEEADLERRGRNAFIRGVDTDIALSERLRDLFSEAGLTSVRVRRYHHEKRIEPPYDEAALEDARRKASGAWLGDHESELRAGLSEEGYDEFRTAWRTMGRSVIERMRQGKYRRVETVPFDVVVGRI